MNINIIPNPNSIKFNGLLSSIDKSQIKYIMDEDIPPEGYRIKIDANSATVHFSDQNGIYYADMTLNELNKNGKIPQCEIDDSPRFHYRAFMLDSSRHMQTIDEIKLFVKAAAKFRFNIFRWHLSDDHGYRIESEVFPDLNKIGSYRVSAGFNSKVQGTYGGFYTKMEIKEIVSLCNDMHIQVVPELDMPGHTMSWLASYPELSCTGKIVEVPTEAGIKSDILCAGKEKVYEFCCKLIDEVAELFPCELFHIGGDEVPKKQWKQCPECQQKIKEQRLKNENQLQDYFTSRITDHLLSIGKKAIVWNDALSSNKVLTDDVIVAAWNDPRNKSARFAELGGKVIAENTTHLYFDYSYSAISLKKAYSFKVISSNITANGASNYIGIEAPLWSEWIDSFDRLCYQAFPRLLAASEVAWTVPERMDYTDFLRRTKLAVNDLNKIGIKSAPMKDWNPLPGRKFK